MGPLGLGAVDVARAHTRLSTYIFHSSPAHYIEMSALSSALCCVGIFVIVCMLVTLNIVKELGICTCSLSFSPAFPASRFNLSQLISECSNKNGNDTVLPRGHILRRTTKR